VKPPRENEKVAPLTLFFSIYRRKTVDIGKDVSYYARFALRSKTIFGRRVAPLKRERYRFEIW
jgi:hypothetical protein